MFFNKTMILGLLSFLMSYSLVNSQQTTPTPEVTTTISDACKALEKDCSTCLQSSKCLWCHKDMPNAKSKCIPYPTEDVIPKSETCPLNDARWGVCWVNYKALLISMGVLAGVIILSISCCCVYCCCCRGKASRQRRYVQEDARIERESAERETRNAERRHERQSKYDDIRKKYGLTKEDGYKRFENE